MNGRLVLSILLLLIPGAAEAGYRRSRDFSAAVTRSVAYDRAIKDAAARYRVDPRLLWTIAYLESRFRPRLVSRKGARGMMQFMPATGRRYGLLTYRDFHDPIRSIEAAAMYLRDLKAMFGGGRIDLVLAGYNAGENAIIRSGYRVPCYYETRSYVARGVSLFRFLGEYNRSSTLALTHFFSESSLRLKFSKSKGESHQHRVPNSHASRSLYYPL